VTGPRHHSAIRDGQLVLGEGPRALGPGERDSLDGYWTPLEVARACVAEIDAEARWQLPRWPRRLLEPSVGGGAWLEAAAEVWPWAERFGIDVDPDAPGLAHADLAGVADFRAFDPDPVDLILGNPPYGGDLVGWLDRSLELAPVVAYLLRGTVLGSLDRLPWWEKHPPATIWVLVPRPKWGGPGQRRASDSADSILVLWIRGERDTRLRWLGWR